MLIENEAPVIEPTWHIRPDNGAGLIYKYSHDDSQFLGLTPDETVAVALCDGDRPLASLKMLLAEVLEISSGEAERIWNGLSKKNDENRSFLVPRTDVSGEFTRPNAARLLADVASQPCTPQRFLRLQAPLMLVVIPTYRCQTNCVYCYAERPDLPLSQHLPKSRWIELLTEAGEFGLDLLTFSGGDPLTYPGIEDLLDVARRYRMACVLPTKTRVKPRRAQRLAALTGKDDVIQVSVDSFDAEVATAMTRTPGYAAIARELIENLVAAGVRVRTNTVVTPLNLTGVASLARELHAMGVWRANITNYSRTNYRHDDKLFLTETQHRELNQTIDRLQIELDWPNLKSNSSPRDFSKPGGASSPESWRGRAHCSGGSSSMTILPNGDVVLCEQVPAAPPFVVGNVRRDSLMDVWNSERVFQFVAPPRETFGAMPCRDCDEFDSCHRVYGRCFRDAYFNYGTMYAPNPTCPRAPAGLRMA